MRFPIMRFGSHSSTTVIELRTTGTQLLSQSRTQIWQHWPKFTYRRSRHLPEQRAIATALSDVDALLGGLDRLIAKKRDLKQAAMQQLLTGQTRLPGFAGSGR